MSSRFKNSSSFKIDNDNAFYFEAERERASQLAQPFVVVVIAMNFTWHVSEQPCWCQQTKKKRINALIYAFDVTTIIVLIELILK